MTKKNGSTKTGQDVNVSQAIREFLDENPKSGPKEAADQISKQIGKEVPPSYVSNIKNLMQKTKRRKAPGRKARKDSGQTFSLAHIASVKSLVADIGRDAVEKLVEAVS